MKLYAHSEAPGSTPYVHLGYTAATSVTPQTGLLFTGLGFAAAGALFALRGARGALRPAPGVTPWRGVAVLLGGLSALVVGVAVLGSSYQLGERRRQHPESITFEALRTVEQEIRTAWDKGIDLPPRTPEMDGWYERIQVRELPSQGGPTYELRSAGPDGRAGTDDDITHVVVVQARK